jgi:Predicted membrane protein
MTKILLWLLYDPFIAFYAIQPGYLYLCFAQDHNGIRCMKPTDFPSALTRRLLGQGQEPDPRFTLANERTFLAWIRTALALLASGIAVEAFALEMFSPGAKQALVVGLLSLSLIVSLSAFYRWLSVERALRQQAALPMSLFTPVLSLSCAALIVGVMAMFWGQR